MIIQSTDEEFDIKYILAVLNSSSISYWFLNHFGKLQRKVFPQFKVKELRQFPIPRIARPKQGPFVQRVTFLIEKKLELHKITGEFLELLESDFGLSKPGRKLETWYTLSFAEFLSELEKRKLSLSLSRKAEWMEHFKKRKALANATREAVEQADNEIDQMVYALFKLTRDEIAEIESAASTTGD